MAQKLIKVGTSVAVVIPKKSLEELGLKAGDAVTVEADRKNKSVHIVAQKQESDDEKHIAELTMNFIHRYRSDLEALADK